MVKVKKNVYAMRSQYTKDVPIKQVKTTIDEDAANKAMFIVRAIDKPLNVVPGKKIGSEYLTAGDAARKRILARKDKEFELIKKHKHKFFI